MRRILAVFSAGLVAVGALAGAAAAKEAALDMSSTPHGTLPGEPWNVTLTIFAGHDEAVGAASPPVVKITNLGTGETLSYKGKQIPFDTSDPVKKWQVRVVFPTAGRWDYSIDDGWTGRVYQYQPVLIVAPAAPAVPASQTGDGSAGGGFPVWPVTGGLIAAALAALAGAFTLRRRRFGAA